MALKKNKMWAVVAYSMPQNKSVEEGRLSDSGFSFKVLHFFATVEKELKMIHTIITRNENNSNELTNHFGFGIASTRDTFKKKIAGLGLVWI